MAVLANGLSVAAGDENVDAGLDENRTKIAGF